MVIIMDKLAWVVIHSENGFTTYHCDNDLPTIEDLQNCYAALHYGYYYINKNPLLIGGIALLTPEQMQAATILGLDCSYWGCTSWYNINTTDWSNPAHGYKPEPEVCICLLGRSRYCPVCK